MLNFGGDEVIWFCVVLAIQAFCFLAGWVWLAVGLIRVRLEYDAPYVRSVYRWRVGITTVAVMFGPITILIYALIPKHIERWIMPPDMSDFLHYHDDLNE